MEYGAYALQSLCNGRVSVHASVRLSVPSIDMCRLPQPGRGQQISIDSCRCPSCGCGRRHVESRGSRLNTNLLFAAMSTERKQRPSASSRVAEYCDERVCVSVSVCLSASISPNHVTKSALWIGVVLARRRDTLCTSGLQMTSRFSTVGAMATCRDRSTGSSVAATS